MTLPTLPQARLATAYLGQPLSYRMDMTGWHEQIDSDLIWDEINAYSEVRERGEKLFSGSLQDKRIKWRALNDFARQAKSYSEALQATKGSARGLLGYYSALNLAKAEILHSNPLAVINKRIHHGLSFDVGRDTGIRSDSIKTAKGVFPLLYEARTGIALPSKTILSVRRLLSRTPEVGREYNLTFNEVSATYAAWYRTVGDSTHSWPIVMLGCDLEKIYETREWNRISRTFEAVSAPSDWRTRFPDVHPRSFPRTMLQGREKITGWDHAACINKTNNAFGSSINVAMEGWCDFVFIPSMYKSRELPMPAFLARYALMFYLSSLIRYRPSRLNPNREQATVWLLEAFARQSPLPLLANGLEGVIQKGVIFRS